jgi:hypothetical protein
MLIAKMACRHWKTAAIIIDEDKIVYTGFWAVRQVFYKDVRSVRHFHFLYWLGMAAFSGAGKTVFVPFVIEDSAGLLSGICEKMKSCGNGGLCDTNGYKKLVRAAMLNDIINIRIFADFPLLVSTASSGFIASLFLALWIWGVDLISAFRWGFAGFIAPLAAYFAANIITAYLISRQPYRGNVASGYCDTGRILTLACFATGIVYCLAGIIFRVIV